MTAVANGLMWSTTWLVPALVLGAAALVVLLWSYRYPNPGFSKRLLCGVLKGLGIVALLLCLLEPQQIGLRPRPRANLVLAMVDNSRSMQIRDADQEATRGELLKEALNPESRWLNRLEQDFDTRRYVFHGRMRSFTETAELTQEGDQSAIAAALSSVADRFRDRPVAAVLLFTDGNATDSIGESFPWDRLPPIYPVDVCGDGPKRDLGFRHVSVSQTNFEQNPVTVRVEVSTSGYTTEELVVELLDEDDQLVTSQTLTPADDGESSSLRLQVQPREGVTCFYSLRVREKDKTETFESNYDSDEATLANNQRWIMVDRGGGPYRVLYVSGRPNWEFKFLRRALEADPEVELVGLIRIARKEPRFAFRDSQLGTRSQLYKGFETNTDEGAEAYDEPVLLRLGTLDEVELREGFPKKAEDLYGYHAILLDDVEAAFFTADQQTLIREFVSRRGGGLLLLGGEQSFLKGGYEHTPLEDLAPVYLDAPPESAAPDEFRVMLTREGWLEPWVRLRASEDLERQRLGGMPPFRTVNRVGDVKPGAIELLTSLDERGQTSPAFVTQRFGLGRSAALMIADLWRWDLRRETPEESDLGRAWRQTVRWLVADVPGRIAVDVERPEATGRNVRLEVTARDETYQPLDNAKVTVEIEAADGESLQLRAEPTDQEAGSFYVGYRPAREGPHRAIVKVSDPDGSEVGERETGWVTDPAQAEFQRIDPDRPLLATLAERTGGKVLSLDGLDDFVTSLSRQEVPVTEQRIYPLWHQWWVFLFAVFCFCAEWALRRTQGLP